MTATAMVCFVVGLSATMVLMGQIPGTAAVRCSYMQLVPCVDAITSSRLAPTGACCSHHAPNYHVYKKSEEGKMKRKENKREGTDAVSRGLGYIKPHRFHLTLRKACVHVIETHLH
ncbi:hypothetical protein L1887_08340 [Cichorium endivia]|nr:hypothetical protein L1887_08340 [Cichorium endivia]